MCVTKCGSFTIFQRISKIQPDDVAWLKAAEPAFEFWNKTEDAIYDELQFAN
jgi:hypothetical protein